jgi:hypothetical protein
MGLSKERSSPRGTVAAGLERRGEKRRTVILRRITLHG